MIDRFFPMAQGYVLELTLMLMKVQFGLDTLKSDALGLQQC